jgi:hypothetical protein
VGYVSAPYRVVYESTGFKSGLTNIVAFILKPDLNISGPHQMIEMPSVFAGRYFFDFITGVGDPEGEYVAAIYSPSENLETTVRIPLYKQAASQTSLDAFATTVTDQLEEITDQVDFISANVI